MFKSTGRKTFISGAGLILLGIVQLALYFLNPEGDHAFGGPTEAFQRIFEGVGLIGIRAKLNAVEPRDKLRKQPEDLVLRDAIK